MKSLTLGQNGNLSKINDHYLIGGSECIGNNMTSLHLKKAIRDGKVNVYLELIQVNSQMNAGAVFGERILLNQRRLTKSIHKMVAQAKINFKSHMLARMARAKQKAKTWYG